MAMKGLRRKNDAMKNNAGIIVLRPHPRSPEKSGQALSPHPPFRHLLQKEKDNG